MKKEFKQALEALAKAGGFTVEFECTYCGKGFHNPEGHESHEIVTFIRPVPEGEDEE